MTFPRTSRARGEQLALPLERTVEGRYRAWLATVDGQRVFAELERRALARANDGARRIEVNDLVASVRRDWRIRINNSHRAPIARDLRARHAMLRPLIEVRCSPRA